MTMTARAILNAVARSVSAERCTWAFAPAPVTPYVVRIPVPEAHIFLRFCTPHWAFGVVLEALTGIWAELA
jgi:hypothetical protein